MPAPWQPEGVSNACRKLLDRAASLIAELFREALEEPRSKRALIDLGYERREQLPLANGPFGWATHDLLGDHDKPLAIRVKS